MSHPSAGTGPVSRRHHDKRLHSRRAIDTAVVCVRDSGERFEGVARDISVGGMYVESDTVPRFGTELELCLLIPGSKAESRLPGTVRWTTAAGFGVQFGLLGARDTHAITEAARRVAPV